MNKENVSTKCPSCIKCTLPTPNIEGAYSLSDIIERKKEIIELLLENPTQEQERCLRTKRMELKDAQIYIKQ